ncbi:MAG: excinuclease ABC subunit UvrA, partial [Kiritimatiellia bacterium]
RGPPVINIHGAREHNLKNVNAIIPRGKFTVITGVSGSGKSTLAFDILFGEGQRRYLASLNAYARQFVKPMAKPDVDAITGIPPTVAIEQRTSRGGVKSTVATVTEIYHFLRLLFSKLGTQYCPTCLVPIETQSCDSIVARILREFRGLGVTIFAPLVMGRKGYYTKLATWAAAKGFPILRVDGKPVEARRWPRLSRYQEHNIELPVAKLRVFPRSEHELRREILRALDFGNGRIIVEADENTDTRGPTHPVFFSIRRVCPRCGRSFEELDPRLFSFNSKHGWCPRCHGTGIMQPTGTSSTQWDLDPGFADQVPYPLAPCPACEGRRLRQEALAVRFHNMSIADFAGLAVSEAQRFFAKLRLTTRESAIARDIVAELEARLRFLERVGLSYLTLDRAIPTLSGGEAQRLRLASQLGSNLCGVCYILDEPTIGLHPRDNERLLKVLRELQSRGNTIVVVEHDEQTIHHADYVVDLGPGGGTEGGQVVAQGRVAVLMKNPASTTGRYLRQPPPHSLVRRKQLSEPERQTTHLKIIGAHLHNLKNIDVAIPLGHLVCVTGVSGSGKSTLVHNVLYQNLHQLLKTKSRSNRSANCSLHGCKAIIGWEGLRRVLDVDQSPIGKTPRSCPATYVGFWDDIRGLFARMPEARMRGYGPGRFSFNLPGGRCEVCGGQGVKRVEMNFLPDVTITCEECGGSRFTPETQAVRFKGKSIVDVLAMTVSEASCFFESEPSIHRPLRLLEEIGLGYLRLGQQSPTLSGGEAQRIKLVTELVKANLDPGCSRVSSPGSPTLYILDEPTVGLHMADVEKLVKVLHKLVGVGHTVVVIEHNLDVIAEADWVIDLGPEGGEKGGHIVAAGHPATIIQNVKSSHTARYLRNFLTRRTSRTSAPWAAVSA